MLRHLPRRPLILFLWVLRHQGEAARAKVADPDGKGNSMGVALHAVMLHHYENTNSAESKENKVMLGKMLP